MSVPDMMKDLRMFLQEAGRFARDAQAGVAGSYKDDGSVLTEVDLAVSRKAMEMLRRWLEQDGHVLVDEEFVKRTPDDVFASSEYQWVLDPIDGTAGYALGRFLWGISLALLHRGKPVGGGIYLPRVDELLLTDGDGTTLRIRNGEAVRLEAVRLPVNSQIFVETYYGGDTRWGRGFKDAKVWINRPESAVQGFHSVLTQAAAGATLIGGFSIWDVAAAVPLARNCGYKVLSVKDGREWTQFEAADFTPNWKLRENWLMCHADNFEVIRQALVADAV